jgi:hypothetical protein
MKFKITTTRDNYSNEKRIEKLKKLGFEFERSKYSGYYIKNTPKIEINTLEELIQLGEEYGLDDGELIVSKGHIEIYDDYREQ